MIPKHQRNSYLLNLGNGENVGGFPSSRKQCVANAESNPILGFLFLHLLLSRRYNIAFHCVV